MTAYNAIPDALLDPDDPLTSDIAFRWRDNPLAMFEGAAGAPRLQLAALETGFTTAGGIGSYVWGRRNTTGDIATGATIAGSTLQPTGAFQGFTGAPTVNSLALGSALTGTWRCMGYYQHSATNMDGATLWLRIA